MNFSNLYLKMMFGLVVLGQISFLYPIDTTAQQKEKPGCWQKTKAVLCVAAVAVAGILGKQYMGGDTNTFQEVSPNFDLSGQLWKVEGTNCCRNGTNIESGVFGGHNAKAAQALVGINKVAECEAIKMLAKPDHKRQYRKDVFRADINGYDGVNYRIGYDLCK